MPSVQKLAIIRDVNELIDDFTEAVLVHGQCPVTSCSLSPIPNVRIAICLNDHRNLFGAGKSCSFQTLAVLWGERSFGAVHWASESPNRCVLGAPSLKTQQALFLSALNRTVCNTSDQTAPSEAPSPPPHAQPPETDAAVPPANPEPILNNIPRRVPVCDLSWQQSHPLIPCIRRRDWHAQAAENRQQRAAHEIQRHAQRTIHPTINSRVLLVAAKLHKSMCNQWITVPSTSWTSSSEEHRTRVYICTCAPGSCYSRPVLCLGLLVPIIFSVPIIYSVL